MLHRLAYSSVATVLFTRDMLAELQDRAVEFNARNGVTGFLVFFETGFLQVLEGPSSSLHSAMLRIDSDARHRDISVFFDEDIDARSFGFWSMRCAQRPPDEIPSPVRALDYLQLVRRTLSGR